MKIPKSFIPKDLDGCIERLLKKQYKTIEERQWEIADYIAKYLVEKKDLKYCNVFYADNKDSLLEVAKEIDLECEVKKFFQDIVGKVNNQLFKYWSRK